MPRTRLEKELRKIESNLNEMGMLACRDLHDAMKSLGKRDTELSKKVIADDSRINGLYSYLKELCIQTIALHQPVAKDLRFITITMDVVYNLERIADYADDIAEIAYYVREYSDNMPEIQEMGDLAVKITENAVKSFVERDVSRAEEIERDEDRIDELFSQIFPKLKEMVSKKPEKFIFALNMVLVAKYLERVGDHATNILGRTKYAVLADIEHI